jgi:hypothetical protein
MSSTKHVPLFPLIVHLLTFAIIGPANTLQSQHFFDVLFLNEKNQKSRLPENPLKYTKGFFIAREGRGLAHKHQVRFSD